VSQDDDGNFTHSELAGGQQTRMAGDDQAVRAYQHRIHEPEGANAAGDLRDLRLGIESPDW
jgi:hypothetical protein